MHVLAYERFFTRKGPPKMSILSEDPKEVYIISACRSPIGTFGGSFHRMRAAELSAIVADACIERAGLDKNKVDEIIWGECHQQADQCNTARVMAIKAGFPSEVPCYTVNKVCTSSMQAIINGVKSIRLGDADIVLAGGVEAMSAAPFALRTARWGQRLQHGVMSDTVWEGFTCAIAGVLMGVTAENLASKYQISRDEQDQVALRSQQNACRAIDEGRFKREIIPVSVKQKKAPPKIIDTDEYPRRNLKMSDLSKLPPVFKKDGTVTAGNASGINDASAAVLLISGKKMAALNLKPHAKITAYACAGVEADVMGYGPVPATQKLLEKTGLSIDQIDLFEVNEAFASQYIAVEKALGLPRGKTNVNGSGISLGHPVGCTGARITVSLLYEMMRNKKKRGLATLCGMGGMATALLLERDE